MWFYVRGDESVGPVEERELKKLLSSGELPAGTLIWRDGFGDWRPARAVGVFGDSIPASGVDVATEDLKPEDAATLHLSIEDAQKLAQAEGERLRAEAAAAAAESEAPPSSEPMLSPPDPLEAPLPPAPVLSPPDSEATIVMPPDQSTLGVREAIAAGRVPGEELVSEPEPVPSLPPQEPPQVADPAVAAASPAKAPPSAAQPGASQGFTGAMPIEDSCYTDADGQPDERQREKATKLLERVDGRLRAVLNEGERIQYVTWVFRLPNLKEFLLLWQWFVIRLRYVAVVTDQRLLLFPLRLLRREEDAGVSQIVRGDASFEVTKTPLFGSALEMDYRRGEGKERLPWLLGGAGGKLGALLSAGGGASTGFGERTFLCPDCGQELSGISGETMPACPGCGLGFRTRDEVIRKALILPGGGYFATNDLIFAVIGGLSELLFVLFVLLGLVMVIFSGWSALFFTFFGLVGLTFLKGFSALFGVVFFREYYPDRSG